MKKNKNVDFDCSSTKIKDKKIYNAKGEHLVTVTKDSIIDKNGLKIATLKKYKRKGFSKIAIYESNDGEYTLHKNNLKRNGQSFGYGMSKIRYVPIFSILASVAFMLSTSIVSLSHIEIKEEFKPIIHVADINGVWNSQNTVAVFDSTIYPGKSGEYKFTVVNTNEYEIKYSFSLNHFYNEQKVNSFPLKYRLRLGSKYLNQEWLPANELVFDQIILVSNQSQIFTVEWYWPFESGKDYFDTRLGIYSGIYSIKLNLQAQLLER